MKVDNKHTFGFIPEKKTKRGNCKPDDKRVAAQSEDEKAAVTPAQTLEDEQDEKSETE